MTNPLPPAAERLAQALDDLYVLDSYGSFNESEAIDRARLVVEAAIAAGRLPVTLAQRVEESRTEGLASITLRIRAALELLDGFVTVDLDGSEMIAAVQMTGDGPTRIQGAINLQAARRELQAALLSVVGAADGVRSTSPLSLTDAMVEAAKIALGLASGNGPSLVVTDTRLRAALRAALAAREEK